MPAVRRVTVYRPLAASGFRLPASGLWLPDYGLRLPRAISHVPPTTSRAKNASPAPCAATSHSRSAERTSKAGGTPAMLPLIPRDPAPVTVVDVNLPL